MEHETLTFAKTLEHPVARVFDAWASREARSAWGPPVAGHVINYTRANFQVGGEDLSVCGPKDNPDTHVAARYLSIVKNERIVFSELIRHSGTDLSASLVSVGFVPVTNGVELSLTVQITSFVGRDIVDGNRRGWSNALDNIATYLRGNRPAGQE